MYELMVEGWFSAAHFLRNYKGKCEKLHGHNWKVQIFIRVSELKKSGIGIDFKILKSI